MLLVRSTTGDMRVKMGSLLVLLVVIYELKFTQLSVAIWAKHTDEILHFVSIDRAVGVFSYPAKNLEVKSLTTRVARRNCRIDAIVTSYI
jgi:ABC-type uncharacterized transport system permease subunit